MRSTFVIGVLAVGGAGCFTDLPVRAPAEAGATSAAEPCAPRVVRLNAEAPFKADSVDASLVPHCAIAGDGEATMRYSIDKDPFYVGCTFSNGLPPDFLAQPDETLEVEYCLTGVTPGRLALWYELPSPGPDPMPRYPFVLVEPGELAAPGCARRRIRVGDLCGDGCRRAQAGATSSQLTLVAENRTTEAGAGEPTYQAQFVSVRKYPASCVCVDDGDCAAPALACTSLDGEGTYKAAYGRCAGDASCAGVCRAAADVPGGATVGRYSSGVDPEIANAFRAAFARQGPVVGAPGCPPAPTADRPAECQACDEIGGACPSPFLFDLGGATAQRFFQPDANVRVTTADPGWSALVHDPSRGRAEALRWPFYQVYRCLRTGGADDDGPAVLGLPLDGAWTDGTTVRQSFEHGELSWIGGEVDVSTTTSADAVNLDDCAAALGATRARLKPLGGADVILFTFATGADGLRANPVKNRVGDISSLAVVSASPTDGDLNPGAAELTIPFSATSQTADFLIPEKTSSRDLTGVALFARIKVISGFSQDPSFPGGVVLLVYDKDYNACYTPFMNVIQGGIWSDYTLDLAKCTETNPARPTDRAHVIAYGVRFDTATGGGATSPPPTQAQIAIDTIGLRAP